MAYLYFFIIACSVIGGFGALHHYAPTLEPYLWLALIVAGAATSWVTRRRVPPPAPSEK